MVTKNKIFINHLEKFPHFLEKQKFEIRRQLFCFLLMQKSALEMQRFRIEKQVQYSIHWYQGFRHIRKKDLNPS